MDVTGRTCCLWTAQDVRSLLPAGSITVRFPKAELRISCVSLVNFDFAISRASTAHRGVFCNQNRCYGDIYIFGDILPSQLLRENIPIALKEWLLSKLFFCPVQSFVFPLCCPWSVESSLSQAVHTAPLTWGKVLYKNVSGASLKIRVCFFFSWAHLSSPKTQYMLVLWHNNALNSGTWILCFKMQMFLFFPKFS